MKREELILRLHDEELGPAEAQAAEALRAEPTARAELEALRRIGDAVRAVDAARPPAPDLTDSILARLANERGVATQPNAPAPAPLAASPRRQAPVRRLAPRPRWELVAGATAALAVAAAFALLVRRPASPSGALSRSATPSAIVGHSEAVAVASADVSGSVQAESPVSIESVDFGAAQGAIFMVSAGATETLVVWTLDDADDKTRKWD